MVTLLIGNQRSLMRDNVRLEIRLLEKVLFIQRVAVNNQVGALAASSVVSCKACAAIKVAMSLEVSVALARF
jgi:hypothetical protein